MRVAPKRPAEPTLASAVALVLAAAARVLLQSRFSVVITHTV